jgi:hypothetical protein
MLAKSLGNSERVNVQKVLGRAKSKKSEESKNNTFSTDPERKFKFWREVLVMT